MAKDKLLTYGPELPLDERVQRYQHNIRAIRASGCAVPVSAMIDTPDPAEIELWPADNSYRIDRLEKAARNLAELPDDTER
jgi:hypothetical protein